MRNLVSLVLLGLGITLCIYYFSINTQDTAPIAQENIDEINFNEKEFAIDGGIEYDLPKQDQQSLDCADSKADMSGIDFNKNGVPEALIQFDDLGNNLQEQNSDSKRRVSFFGHYKLQKFAHQHSSENCACTMPKNDRSSKKKLSGPRWLPVVRRIEKN